MPFAVAMAKIVFGGEEGSVAVAAVLRLELGFQEMFSRLEMGLLTCFVWAMNIADCTVECLIFSLIVNTALFALFSASYCLGNVLLSWKRHKLNRMLSRNW